MCVSEVSSWSCEYWGNRWLFEKHLFERQINKTTDVLCMHAIEFFHNITQLSVIVKSWLSLSLRNLVHKPWVYE